ncbi:hypothetical protein PVK06_025883 [Gossypium arboreum]|uniref:Uncharacterized protein n=1 Tax=Gossypium arboreum TaxID=29729 RepID=A0ABR0NW39_GOSAR|nr:hypothetical protein PVK06_025883 [Gossypium arboreum]
MPFKLLIFQKPGLDGRNCIADAHYMLAIFPESGVENHLAWDVTDELLKDIMQSHCDNDLPLLMLMSARKFYPETLHKLMMLLISDCEFFGRIRAKLQVSKLLVVCPRRAL